MKRFILIAAILCVAAAGVACVGGAGYIWYEVSAYQDEVAKDQRDAKEREQRTRRIADELNK